jgi:hypothetical protein
MIAREHTGENWTISQSTIFEILSSRRRRMVLSLLRGAEEPVDLATLTEQIASEETNQPVDEVPPQARKRVYVSLYQTHLPRLEDAGLIDYDTETGTITRSKRAAAVDSYLPTNREDRPWAIYYLFIALSGLSGVLAAGTNVGVVGEICPVMVTSGVLGVILVLTLLHAVAERGQSEDTIQGP